MKTFKRLQRQSLLMACLFGLFGGLLSSAAYPDNAIWIAIFPAVAFILYSITSVPTKQSLLVGFIAGFAFYASQIPWMTVYLGPVPWLALSILEATIFAVGSLAIAATWAKLKTLHRTFFSDTLAALSIASLWTAREWLSCNFPYGGFPWSRVALSQSNSPLAAWVFWGGISALSFVIVFVCVLLMLGWQNLHPRRWHKSFTFVALMLTVTVPLITPLDNSEQVGSLDIAAVQGNAKAGLLVVQRQGTILQNHLDASAPLLEEKKKPQLVVWPENAADLSPLQSSDSKWQIDNFVSRVGAPLLFGTITERDGQIYNSSLLWQNQVGVTDWYDKKRPVAFGEFVPDRSFWRMLAPSLIDLIPRGYSFGTRDGIFDAANTKVGTMICFEVAVDDISRDLISQKAAVLVAQTNNSDFGRTNESTQQLAIARLRAIETSRAFVNISTVGTSAIIMPDGTISQQLPIYQAAVMRETVPLRNSITPAMMFGSSFELANNFSAVAQIIFLIWLKLARRKIGGAA